MPLRLRCSRAQDLVTIQHTHYTSVFSERLGYPVLVYWTVQATDICPKGTQGNVNSLADFSPDPQIASATNFSAYYAKKGSYNSIYKWKQGHNCEADDSSCNLTLRPIPIANPAD